MRIIVIPERVTDDELPKLVHDIGTEIQKQVMVPGAVKITAVRETRAQSLSFAIYDIVNQALYPFHNTIVTHFRTLRD